jgi:hypothetical protein
MESLAGGGWRAVNQRDSEPKIMRVEAGRSPARDSVDEMPERMTFSLNRRRMRARARKWQKSTSGHLHGKALIKPSFHQKANELKFPHAMTAATSAAQFAQRARRQLPCQRRPGGQLHRQTVKGTVDQQIAEAMRQTPAQQRQFRPAPGVKRRRGGQ